MNYRTYVERKEDGTAQMSRKSRKSNRKIVFAFNKKLHSKRSKRGL